MQSTALILEQEIQPQISFIQVCVDQLDEQRKTEIKPQFNSLIQSIVHLVERAIRGNIIYILSVNVKDLIDSIRNAADTLAKQGVLGISMEQFTKCYEEVAIRLEKIVVVMFDELIRLATQRIEQAIAFYNDFLERQARYQQETPKQRQAEKAWIDQQRSQLVRVQNGIEDILNQSAG
ncbi:hypothetical protein [Fortiea contorta]|uniref:hypothetical protein n=1 Tax=Fortiea contorta TaxID=1892405 RepID=UPI0003479A74|nr:hypothetical protein [Fortiea contorta]